MDTGNELDFDLLARDIDAALGFDLCKSSAHKMTTPGRVHRIAACSTAGLLTLGLPKRPRTDATQNCPDVLFGVGILRPRHVGRHCFKGCQLIQDTSAFDCLTMQGVNVTCKVQQQQQHVHCRDVLRRITIPP